MTININQFISSGKGSSRGLGGDSIEIGQIVMLPSYPYELNSFLEVDDKTFLRTGITFKDFNNEFPNFGATPVNEQLEITGTNEYLLNYSSNDMHNFQGGCNWGGQVYTLWYYNGRYYFNVGNMFNDQRKCISKSGAFGIHTPTGAKKPIDITRGHDGACFVLWDNGIIEGFIINNKTKNSSRTITWNGLIPSYIDFDGGSYYLYYQYVGWKRYNSSWGVVGDFTPVIGDRLRVVRWGRNKIGGTVNVDRICMGRFNHVQYTANQLQAYSPMSVQSNYSLVFGYFHSDGYYYYGVASNHHSRGYVCRIPYTSGPNVRVITSKDCREEGKVGFIRIK